MQKISVTKSVENVGPLSLNSSILYDLVLKILFVKSKFLIYLTCSIKGKIIQKNINLLYGNQFSFKHFNYVNLILNILTITNLIINFPFCQFNRDDLSI